MRRDTTTADSLDLLLDAISNAFGVILLIALLVSMQLQIVSSKEMQTLRQLQEDPDRLKVAELKKEIQDLLGTIQLLDALRSAQKNSEKILEDVGSAEDASELAKLKKQLGGLLKTQTALENERKSLQEQAKFEQLSREARKTEVATRQSQLKELRKEIASDRRRRTRESSPPAIRSVGTMELTVLLRYGRLYKMYEGSGASYEPINFDDMVVVNESWLSTRITPNPAAGTPVDDEVSADQWVHRQLRKSPPENFHVGLIAWDDSFQFYPEVRSALRKRGYRLRILPAEAGMIYLNQGGRQEAQ